jgi:DNA polymerase-1|nr:MAG TPA: DNA POLYMERASE [Caudoviricetes sp.]
MVVNSYATEQDEQEGAAVMPSSLVERLRAIGLDPEKVYYTNAIKCACPRGTKYKVGDIKKCKQHLDKEIAAIQPTYVLVLGAQALKATVDGSITELNGVMVEKDGIKYMPSYSPGIVYRDPGKAPFVEKAMNNFKAMMEGSLEGLPELDIRLITNMRELKRAFHHLKDNNYLHLSYDIETTGLVRFEDEVNLFGFGNDQVQYIIPLEARYSPLKGARLAQRKLIRTCVNWLNRNAKALVAGNGKFDDLFLKYRFGVKPNITFDVVLASHILNENTPNGVKENAVLECNAPEWDVDKDLKTGKYKTREKYQEYLTYLGYDIYYEYKLYKVFHRKLKQDRALMKLFYHLYMPGIISYETVEEHGVFIYPQQFKKVRKHLESEREAIEKQLLKLAKHEVNWNSPAQIQKLLYEELKLPVIETTESGSPSTSEATLMQLRDKHPIVELILKYRGVNIQISHFIDGWINRMWGRRLFPNFKLHGTVTGRTSCTDPNLQQVPRDPIIRNLVGAPEGWSVVEIDYSQAELRIAAIMSGDETMKRIYQTGGDIHTHTYEMITGEKVSDDKYIKKEQRKKAKAVNFGFVYGMGWRKFKIYARDNYGVDLTDKEAEQWRERFFQAYHFLPKWHSKQRRIVQSMGQVRSPIGRLRRLPDIYSTDKSKKAEAERQSINSPVQGFGSDLTILGMSEIMGNAQYYDPDYVLDKDKFFVIGTVHDATLFEVRNDYLMEFCPRAKHILEHPKALEDVFHFDTDVPIVADVAVGKSWGAGIELHMEEGGDWQEQLKTYLDGLK